MCADAIILALGIDLCLLVGGLCFASVRGGMLSDEERQGVDRIAEALKANMWEHLTLKSREDRFQGNSEQCDDEEENEEAEQETIEDNGLSADLQSSHDSIKSADTVASSAPDVTPPVDAAKSSRNAAVVGASTSASTTTGTSPPAAAPQQQRNQDLHALAAATFGEDMTGMPPDPQMDMFMQAFERVMAVRKEAAGLPDELRKQRAADTIMEVMRWFGDGDEDEEDID